MIFLRQVRVIASRDLKQFLLSPLFYVFAGVSCVFLSYVFPRDLFRFAQSYVMPAFQQGAQQARNIHFEVFVSHISYINLILLFCIPILSMKLLAEEKKNRTYDLLMTSPVSSLQIVVGKYLALLGVLLIFLLITLFYPLSTVFVTDIPVGPLFSSYMGIFLLGSVYSAIGLFTSSLTASLFLSVFIGIILNISVWFISQGQEFSNPFINSMMEYLSLSNHLTNFVKGSLVINSFAFFFTFIIFFLFLVYKVLEFSRWRS
ncbi:MAG: ABC transporter permease [Bdellovibrionales bacterium]